MLNKLTVSELAELSNLSKAYISQVKHGKRPPYQKLLDALSHLDKRNSDVNDYITLFLHSRQANGVSPQTIRYYRDRLSNYVSRAHYLKASRLEVENYFRNISPNQYGLGTRHA